MCGIDVDHLDLRVDDEAVKLLQTARSSRRMAINAYVSTTTRSARIVLTRRSSTASVRRMNPHAVVLAGDLFETLYAKTTHGLVRGPSRYPLAAVVDRACAGRDAGEVLDGRANSIPIVDSIASLDCQAKEITHCIVGVANHGGRMTDTVRAELKLAARAGMTLVNGLHQYLADDPELVALATEHGGEVIDFRRTRPPEELRFWTGEVLASDVPSVAVLGTDCALGKRTTAGFCAPSCAGAVSAPR